MKPLIKEIQHCSAKEMFIPPYSEREPLPDFQKGKNRLSYVFKRQGAGDPKSSRTTEIHSQVFNDSLARIKSPFNEGSKTQSLINKATQKMQIYSHRWYVNGSFGAEINELVAMLKDI